MIANKKHLLTTTEFAKYDQVNIRTLWRRIQKKTIPIIKAKNPKGYGKNGLENYIHYIHLSTPEARESFLKDRGLLYPQEKKAPESKDLINLKPWEKETGRKRETIVKRYIDEVADVPKLKKTTFTKGFAQREGLSTATLDRWLKGYNEAGLQGLIPAWNNGDKEGKITPEIAKFIETTYLQNFGPSVKQVHELIITTYPDKHISYRILADYIYRRWTKSEQLLIRNKEAWDRLYSPHVRRDWSAAEVNEVWIGDAKQVDVACLYKGKAIFPWLTAFLDARSRKFTGWILTPTHNSWSIGQSFCYGVRTHGVPRTIYIDRGKPYKSVLIAGTKPQHGKLIKLFEDLEPIELSGLFGEFGCEIFFAAPYNAREKIIEANFGIFTDRLRHTPGYRGHSVKTRPKKLEQEIKSGKLLSFEELSQEIDKIINDRNGRPHSTTGKIPNSFYEGHTFPIPSERYLAYLLMDARRVKVKDSTVFIEGMLYRSDDLWKLAGEPVEVRRDPKDLRRAAIIHQGKLFGFADLETPDHYRGPITMESRKTCARIRKKISKFRKAIIEGEELLENTTELDTELNQIEKLRVRDIRQPSPKIQSIHQREKLSKVVVEGLKKEPVQEVKKKAAAAGTSLFDRYTESLTQREIKKRARHTNLLDRIIALEEQKGF